MALNQTTLKSVRQRRYLARDFDSLRAMLLDYARLYYADKIQDFSESSIGGIFLDFAAAAGDNLSFYLDHQFGELDPTTAVENTNIEKALKRVGVPIVGAAPAIVPCTVYVQVPAQTVNNVTAPMSSAIPVVKAGSIFTADNGVTFNLIEDIDFSDTNSDGTFKADIKGTAPLSDGTPSAYIMAYSGMCVSGEETSENIALGSTFVPFKQITLSNANVSEIISVYDALGNTYYQVGTLTHDVVYQNVLNTASDNDIVKDALKIIPAPYRFKTDVDINTRRTTMTMGGGNADTLEDDVVPDPSDFAISFPYKKTFSRLPINPNQLLQTKTLGVSATNTTLTVVYRHGGGLSHNVPENSIQTITTLNMEFNGNPSPAVAGAVRSSAEVTNKIKAVAGEDAPSLDDLKDLIPAIKNSQERIVSRQDLLARVYTLPSNFGRVYRAAVRSNPNNPLATQMYIVSRNQQSKLITSPDTLKQNLVKYLNPYRMISDAIDILDAKIINYTLTFDVLIDPNLNKNVVLQNILTKLQSVFDIKNFHIDQPIVISEIRNSIYSTQGIISVNSVRFDSVSGVYKNRQYSDYSFDFASNTKQDIIFPPPGGIFECRYPEVDIVGRAVV